MRVTFDEDVRAQVLAAAGFWLYSDRNFWIDPSGKKIAVRSYAETCALEELQAFLEKENTSGTWEVFAEEEMERRAIRAAIVRVTA